MTRLMCLSGSFSRVSKNHCAPFFYTIHGFPIEARHPNFLPSLTFDERLRTLTFFKQEEYLSIIITYAKVILTLLSEYLIEMKPT